MAELAKAPLKRILKQKSKRVSADAVELMRNKLEEKAEEMAERATKLAQHAGRKTVKKEDVRALD